MAPLHFSMLLPYPCFAYLLCLLLQSWKMSTWLNQIMMCLYSLTCHSKNASKKCPICCTAVSNLKRHVYGIHLPYWYDSQLACLHCQTYIGSIGRLRGQHLDVHASASCKFTNATKYQQRIMYFIKCLSLEVTGSDDVSGLLKLVHENQW